MCFEIYLCVALVGHRSIGNPCDAKFVLSEPSLYTYSLTTPSFTNKHGGKDIRPSGFCKKVLWLGCYRGKKSKKK